VSNLQIKNIPEDLHAELRRRAGARGMSLRDYVLDLLRREASRPDLDEWLDRVAADPPVTLAESPVELVRAARAEREATIDRVLRGR
jgi:plasmid stability protein